MFSPPVTSPGYDQLHLKLISVKNHGQCKLCRILGGSRNFCSEEILGVSWQNQQNACSPREDSDQPGRMPAWADGIRPVWSESLLSAWSKLRSSATQWAHSKDSNQTGRMPRLIWVFAGRTATLLVLSWGGLIMYLVISLIFTIIGLCAHLFYML